MIDYHLHSTYSIDGRSASSSYVERAEQLSLTGIGFAEHLDLDPHTGVPLHFDYPSYLATIEALRQTTAIPIQCGAEVGYQPHLEDDLHAVLSQFACDFVIGSVHELEGVLMDETFFQTFTPPQYFNAVEKSVESGWVDIVGHLEYFKKWGGPYSSAHYEKEITALLQKMIERHVVLEVNTSGLRHAAGDTYPSLYVLQLYRKLGGALISLGSDAHGTEYCGYEFARIVEKLTEMGFDTLATFNKRVLHLVEL